MLVTFDRVCLCIGASAYVSLCVSLYVNMPARQFIRVLSLREFMYQCLTVYKQLRIGMCIGVLKLGYCLTESRVSAQSADLGRPVSV